MENGEYKFTEQQVSHTKVHDSRCMGCLRHKKDVMITFIETPDGKIAHDMFLTESQAKELIVQIKKTLARNDDKQLVETKALFSNDKKLEKLKDPVVHEILYDILHKRRLKYSKADNSGQQNDYKEMVKELEKDYKNSILVEIHKEGMKKLEDETGIYSGDY